MYSFQQKEFPAGSFNHTHKKNITWKKKDKKKCKNLSSTLLSVPSFRRQELQLSPYVSDSTSFTWRRSQHRHLMWQPFLRRALITLTPEEARGTYLCGRRQLSLRVISRKATDDGDWWAIGTLWATRIITSISLAKRTLASNEFISLTLWSGDWSFKCVPPLPQPAPAPHFSTSHLHNDIITVKRLST